MSEIKVEEIETAPEALKIAHDWAATAADPLAKFTAQQLADELFSRCVAGVVSLVAVENNKPLAIRRIHGDPVVVYGHVGTLFDEVRDMIIDGARKARAPRIAVPR